jgi:hypothetical protein
LAAPPQRVSVQTPLSWVQMIIGAAMQSKRIRSFSEGGLAIVEV